MAGKLAHVTETRPATRADIPEFPATRPESCPFDPDSAFTRLRAEDPVTPVRCPAGMDAWLVSRYEDIRAVLADPRVSARAATSNHMLPDYDDADPLPGAILSHDGEEHARLRRLLIGEFTVRRMEALRPYIQRITDEHIDGMLKGADADLLTDFALPIPSLVICEMLGVPYADRDMFQHDSQVLIGFEADMATREATAQRLRDYLRELIEQRMVEPRDDLVSRLIARGNETDRPLIMEELEILALSLLVAGHETTANTIVLSMSALLANPEQLAAMRAAPETIGTAVEELLRYLSVVQFGIFRYATEDLTVGGIDVKAGEWLIAATQSGNRDEQVYPHADRLDVTRKDRTHLAFGFGAHQCIGQQLARIELQVALTALLQRVPGLRLAEPQAPSDFKHNGIVYGLRSMPVTW
ncbi:cytochrome P450 [Kutzneria buriramensis]|uniref:Cytochrome P450 n=1 Tax=Kutzneria buriramensis TaxID=1045776 RepID=A0A3E0GXB2_9PSEU|nr:cytochrome P450 [Kutzneria buriramensis]